MTLTPSRPASLGTLLLGSILLVPLAHAQELDESVRNRYESTGVFGGAAAGAVLGGPAGAVVGAAAGGWLGDQMLARRENRLLKTHLENTRQELLALQENNTRLQQQLSAARQAADSVRRQVASAGNYPPGLNSIFSEGAGYMAFTGSELVLHFRTGSAEIEPHYRRNLAEFVRAASLISDAEVSIQGNTDRRGDETANLELSRQRVQAVQNELGRLGLGNVAWTVTAMGEQEPISTQDGFENNFFDRRVVLRVQPRNTELLSRNQP